MGWVVIDTETGGLDPAQHTLLTVGLILADDAFEEIHRQEWLVHPGDRGYHCTDEALRINRIDLEEHRKRAVPAKIVSDEIRATLRRHFKHHKPGLIGFNLAMFDLPFLRQVLPVEPLVAYHQVIDLMHATRFLADCGMTYGRRGLQDIATACGLRCVGEPHSTLVDADLTLRLYRHLRERVAYK